MEQYSRGRRGRTRNAIGRVTAARVQIPAAPLFIPISLLDIGIFSFIPSLYTIFSLYPGFAGFNHAISKVLLRFNPPVFFKHPIHFQYFPSGEIFEHKKDIPTQFENCYYTNGDENNVLVTPIGNLGVALCWEMIRYDTLKRISGRVDLILAGSCWWDIPIDAPRDKDSLRQYNQSLACETPLTFSKLAGVPIVHANHCGRITAYNFPDKNKLQTRQLVGATQIIDKQGHPLAKKHFFEGEGIVISDLTWDTSERQKIRKFPSSYWIPKLPDPYIHAWDTINPKAKLYYETVVLPHYKAVKTNPN